MKRITWNRRYNMYIDKMKTGSIFEVADVVRTLAVQEEDKEAFHRGTASSFNGKANLVERGHAC